MLRVNEPSQPHSVSLFWSETGQFASWYINLETPLQPTRLGFDFTDQILDIVIAPDLSRWWWKDEDELAEAVRRGIYTAADAATIRTEGERALERLLARAWPFDHPWEDWQPPGDWTTPQLPDGWDIID